MSQPSPVKQRSLGESIDPLPEEEAAALAPARRPSPPPGTTLPPPPGKWRYVLLGLAGLLALGIVAFELLPAGVLEDAHLTRAKAQLELYERSRSESERNYRNPIYAEALADLDQVPQQSLSFSEASGLATDVRLRIDAFLKRIEAASHKTEELVEERQRRDQEFIAAQRRAALIPKTTFPECEHEGAKGHRHPVTR